VGGSDQLQPEVKELALLRRSVEDLRKEQRLEANLESELVLRDMLPAAVSQAGGVAGADRCP
jgi:hypothetical protein